MWKPWKSSDEFQTQAPEKKPIPSASGSDREFQAAVEETTAQPEVSPEPSAPEPEKRASFWERFKIAGRKEPVGITVKDKWARGVVKVCFLPLAKYDHPAWRLTDSEAEMARPEMQEFLQALSNRYTPGLLARFEKRHPEFVDMLVAMVSLYYVKYKAVSLVVLAEEARGEARKARSREEAGKVTQFGVSPEEAKNYEVEVPEHPFHCFRCGANFDTWESQSTHDCPAKSV